MKSIFSFLKIVQAALKSWIMVLKVPASVAGFASWAAIVFFAITSMVILVVAALAYSLLNQRKSERVASELEQTADDHCYGTNSTVVSGLDDFLLYVREDGTTTMYKHELYD